MATANRCVAVGLSIAFGAGHKTVARHHAVNSPLHPGNVNIFPDTEVKNSRVYGGRRAQKASSLSMLTRGIEKGAHQM